MSALPRSAAGAASPRWASILGPLLTVGIAYLFFFAGGYYGIYVVQVRMTSVLIAATVLIAWLVVAARRPAWAPTSALWSAIATGLLALAITTVLSRNPRISMDILAYAVLLAGLYLLLRALLTSTALRPRLGAAMVILAFGLDLAYLLTVGATWRTWWEVVGRLTVPPLRPFYEGLTYGNPGLVAALAVLASIAATAYLGLGRRLARLGAAGLWLLTVAVVIVSGARGAWIALAATAVVALALLLATADSRRWLRAVLSTRQGAIAAVIGAVVLAGAAIAVGPTVVDRLVNSGEGGRTSYWAASIRMFLDAPIAGVGAGMWAPQRILHTAVGEIDYYIPHAHNAAFQTLAEMGLVGIVGGLAVLALVGRFVRRAARDGDPVRRRWAVAAVLGTVYFAVHQQVDLYLNMPAALFAFAVPFAWLDAIAGPGDRPVGRLAVLRLPGGAIVPLLAAAIMTAAGWALWSDRSALALDAAGGAFRAGDWAAAERDAADSVALDPSLPPNQMALALTAARTGDTSAIRPALLAVTAADDLPAAWIDLAWTQAVDGDDAGARASLDRGLRVGRQQPAIEMAAGYVYERLGDTAAADALYASILEALPQVAGDPFWQDASRIARWPALRATVAAALSGSSFIQLYLAEGDLGRARKSAAAIGDPVLAAQLTTIVDAWGGSPQAIAALGAMASASSRDVAILGWAAWVASHNGDADAAARYRYWAGAVDAVGGPYGMGVRVETRPGPSPYVAGETSGPYGIYTYRRPLFASLLLPDLPLLVWAE